MRKAGVLVLFLAISAPPAAAAAPCPQSCTQNMLIGVCTTAATRDTSTSEPCDFYGYQETHASFDLVTGQVSTSAYTCYGPARNAFAHVTARDRFRVVGPSGGPPVSFEARLSANGQAGGFGTVIAQIGEVGGEYRTVHDNGQGGFIAVLVLPLSHAVGEEFELVYEVGASAEVTAMAQGTLGFVMPAGYGVTSCQGFAGQGAVSTRRASWGALKQHYR